MENRFMQNNDPKYTSHFAKAFHMAYGVNWWPKPASSADFKFQPHWMSLDRASSSVLYIARTVKPLSKQELAIIDHNSNLSLYLIIEQRTNFKVKAIARPTKGHLYTLVSEWQCIYCWSDNGCCVWLIVGHPYKALCQLSPDFKILFVSQLQKGASG